MSQVDPTEEYTQLTHGEDKLTALLLQGFPITGECFFLEKIKSSGVVTHIDLIKRLQH